MQLAQRIFSILLLTIIVIGANGQDTIRTYYPSNPTLLFIEHEVQSGTVIKSGFFKLYHENGQVIEHREYKEGKIWNVIGIYDSLGVEILNKGTLKDGDGITHNYFDGNLMAICSYKKGIKHGQYIKFWENGVVRETGNYYMGEKCGTWYKYLRNGQLSYGHKFVKLIECGKGEPNKDNDFSAESYLENGMAKMIDENYEDALKDINMAISLDSNYIEAFYLRGKLKYLIMDKKGAIDDYTRVIELNPKHMEAYFWRAFASQFDDLKASCSDWLAASKLGHPSAAEYIETFCK